MKYICELCGTVYDEAAGDPNRGISANTSFSSLPKSFSCPSCGAEKEAFTPASQLAKFRSPDQPVQGFGQYVKYSEPGKESER